MNASRLLLLGSLLALVPAGARAVTLNQSPLAPSTGSNVNFTIDYHFSDSVPPPCSFRLDFGDGTSAQVSNGVCTSGGFITSCSAFANHVYNLSGTFTAVADLTACGPTPPAIASVSFSVVSAPPPCPPLSITTTSLSAATQNQPYSFQLQRSGGQGSVSFILGSGTLPSGIFLSPGGLLSGTPTSPVNNLSFTVRATDACSPPQSATRALTLTVNAACPALSLTTASLPAATQGQPYSAQLQSSGGAGAVTFALASGSLPAGLTLTPGGLVSGTPTAPGLGQPFSVVATDACSPPQSATRALSLTVNAPCPALSVATASLPAATQGQPYSVQLQPTGGSGAVTFALASGSLPAGLSLTPGGLLSGTPTAPVIGQPFSVMVTDSCSPVQSATRALALTVNAACPALSLATASVPPATQGQPYSAQLQSSGGAGAVTFALASGSLPSGLTLTPGGLLSGTPTTQVSASPFTVVAIDSCSPRQSVTRSFSLTVTCSPLSVATAALPTATQGAPYSFQLQPSGGSGAVTFALGSGTLPAGLSLTPGGLLSGTPTASVASAPFTVVATDSCSPAQSATRSLSLTVTATCPALSVATATLPPATQGAPFSFQLQPSGGSGVVTFALGSGTLPAGLSLTAGGLLSGTPTTAVASASFTVVATDSCSPVQSATRSLTVTVSAAAPSSTGPVSFSVSPSTASVPRGEATPAPLDYSFSAAATANVVLTSETAELLAGTQTVETLRSPLTVPLSAGRGAARETAIVPPGAVERALALGETSLFLRRTFTGADVPISVTTRLDITSEAGAAFSIRRIALSFDGKGKTRTTVARGAPGLKAVAELRYVGTGLLEARWEVDGRLLANVTRQLVSGTTALIETPVAPPLPTFAPGSHVVRFIVTSPPSGLPVPAITYTVVPEPAAAPLEPLTLVGPADGEVLPFAPPTFRWRPEAADGTWELRFFREASETDALLEGPKPPFFSAYATGTSYTVPAPVFRTLFAPGASYRWQVRLLKNGEEVAVTAPRRFSLRHPTERPAGR